MTEINPLYTKRKFSVDHGEVDEIENPAKRVKLMKNIFAANEAVEGVQEVVSGKLEENFNPEGLLAVEIDAITENLRQYFPVVEGAVSNKNKIGVESSTREKLEEELTRIKKISLEESGFNEEIIQENLADSEEVKRAKLKLKAVYDHIMQM
jgi:hypothetical protein